MDSSDGTEAKEVQNGTDSFTYQCMTKCVENFIRSQRDRPGTCKRLAKAFPDFYRSNPDAFQAFADALWTKYCKVVTESVAELMESTEMETNLKEIEQLGPEGSGQWRPSGVPSEDVAAHVALARKSEIDDLQARLQKEEAEIETLQASLRNKDKVIEQKLLHLTADTEKWVDASNICQQNQEKLFLLLKNAKNN